MQSQASRIRRIHNAVDTQRCVSCVACESSLDDPMYVLFLNVKRRGTPRLTNHLADCSVSSRVVVMVQWLAHPTSNQGDAGSIPTHGNMFFIQWFC